MGKETVAVIGRGGAESALVHKYSQSEYVERIIAIPGNDMMQELTEGVPVETYPDVKTNDTGAILEILRDRRKEVAFADIRDESAIEANLSGALRKNKISTVGHNANAGRLETDKFYARRLNEELDISQPRHDALVYLQGRTPRYIIPVIERHALRDEITFVKANGLAQGKGVIGAKGREEIEEAIREIRDNFPEASNTILIEEGLIGEEFSAFAMAVGDEYQILGYAQDHKRLYDNDQGPNTGGMGAVSNPLLLENPVLRQEIESIFKKISKRTPSMGRSMRGVVYLGGMAVEEEGKLTAKVIEYNMRWGDPEAQVLLPGIETDLYEVGIAVSKPGNSKLPSIVRDSKIRVAVAGVSKGYPGDYSDVRGKEIEGIPAAKKVDGITVYGAGIRKENNRYYADGGRVFYVVGEGNDVIEARDNAYEAISHISIDGEGLHYRTDIGRRDLERLHK